MRARFLLARYQTTVRLVSVILLLQVPLAGSAVTDARARDHLGSRHALTLTPQISITPTAASPGSTVTVSGSHFQPGEVVTIGLGLQPLVSVASATDGTIPPTSITIPLGTPVGRHVIYARGVSSGGTGLVQLTVLPLQPTIKLSATAFDVGREACVSGSGFAPHETIVVQVNSAPAAFGQADGTGAFTVCFNMPVTIASGANTVTVRGVQTGTSTSASFTGVLPLSTSYFFAGGSTLNGDTTELPLLNPGSLRTRVVLTLYTRTQVVTMHDIVVKPHTRLTINLGATVGRGSTFGLRLQADQAVAAQIVVHRSKNMPYSLVGAPDLSTTWYLAEGYTGGTFHDFVHILNPLRTKARIVVTTMPSGGKPHTLSYIVPPQRSATLELNRLSPHSSFATTVSSTSPIMIARVMTYGPRDYGAGAATGIATPRKRWNFINGSVATGTQTYLLIYNPNRKDTASLSLKLYSAIGIQLVTHTERVAPRQRVTLQISDLIRGSAVMSGTGSIDIAASSATPLIVEQSTYDGNPDQGHTASTLSAPSQAAATHWTFATGDTSQGARESLTLFNPNALPINVQATFTFADSTTKSFQVAVAAYSQATVDPGPLGYNLPASPHGVQLSSLLFPFAVEQSIYPAGITAPYTSLGIPM